MRVSRFRFAAILLVTAAVFVVIAVPVTVRAPAAARSCAWSGEPDQRDVNIGAPDLDAFYFAASVTPRPGTEVVLSGHYPRARYFSFAIYDQQGQPIATAYDRQIAPDPGSANPYRARPRRGAGRGYHLRFVFGSQAPAGAANTVTAPVPAGNAHSLLLVLRIYVPQVPASDIASLPYPELITEGVHGTPESVQVGCVSIVSTGKAAYWKHYALESLPAAAATPAVAGATPTPEWSRAFGSQFGNPQNAYLTTLIAHHYGEVVVIHARAPDFPDTSAGQPPYAPSQLRYWSMCTYDVAGQAVLGCAADHRTAIRAGAFTYVISDPAHRPSNATAANGITWLPWGPTNAIQVVYRNMLPSPSFRNAVQRVRTPHQSVITTLGRYYPVARYCSTASFERLGWRDCGR